MTRAVMDVYSELLFDESKFVSPPRKYSSSLLKLLLHLLFILILMLMLILIFDVVKRWNRQARRSFFDEFAKANGFDPLAADSWYSISLEHLLSVKVSPSNDLPPFLFYYLPHSPLLSVRLSNRFPLGWSVRDAPLHKLILQSPARPLP